MKTIGLLGGMSWESTADYYHQINTAIKNELGGLHSAKIALFSVDFAEIEALQHKGEWLQAGELLANAAKSVEMAGADFLILCTNTMHIVAEQIQQNIKIPLIHIADATGEVLQQKKIKTVGLLGTSFTMKQDFYKKRLETRYSVNIIIPSESERKQVHDIIYKELCQGEITDEAKATYLSIIKNLAKAGAEGIILGCTEIGMLIKQADTETPLFDTTLIHAEKAVQLEPVTYFV